MQSIQVDADHLFDHGLHAQFLISNAYLLGGRQLACLTCPLRQTNELLEVFA
ncbi:MAG: hypothetical protein SGJ19_17895 [Planctomycetia bacterium]|nr:hypothetical protein [Planctomycetia bacterium]